MQHICVDAPQGAMRRAAPWNARANSAHISAGEETWKTGSCKAPWRAPSIAICIRRMPGVTALLPYLNDYWRDQISNRHIDKLPFQLSSYPPTSPLSARPDWRPAPGQKAGDWSRSARMCLTPWGSAMPSATRCTARWRCSTTTWPPRSARPSTTGWPRSCWTPSRACAPRSCCRPTTWSSPCARSSGWRPTSASCRCCSWPWARRRSAAAPTGRCSPPARSTGWRWASTPAAPIATRPPTPAGPPTGWRTTWPRPAPSRRSS